MAKQIVYGEQSRQKITASSAESVGRYPAT